MPDDSVFAYGTEADRAFAERFAAAAPEGMLAIPAGTFWMGCNETLDKMCKSDEKPQHAVKLAAFDIDRGEVTNQQYKLCIADGDCTPTESTKYSGSTSQQPNSMPVTGVTWDQAYAYCKWRGGPQGRFRLPTEAEWEMAARGDCELNSAGDSVNACAAQMRTYPWGEGEPSCQTAVMRGAGTECGSESATAGGTKLRGFTPYGGYDFAGNVAEWVSDAYAPYGSGGGGSGSGLHIVRGGSYLDPPEALRAAKRRAVNGSNVSPDIGFRCVSLDCSAAGCDDKNPCTTDSCDRKTGWCLHSENTAECEDGNYCTVGDRCSFGKCYGGGERTCDPPGGCEYPGQCRADLGRCEYAKRSNGTSCSDDNLCTTSDRCTNGTCSGEDSHSCSDGNPCTLDVCDPKTAACSYPGSATLVGTSCNDKANCTVSDICDGNGGCAGNPAPCYRQNPCETFGCDIAADKCVYANLDGKCDDGLICTLNSCREGKCQNDGPTPCSALDSCHVAGTCTEANKGCDNPPAAAGKACDDGNPCTVGDACGGGDCSGSAKPCSDDNPCTNDGCDTASGGTCKHPGSQALKNAKCDDGSLCTTLDLCDADGGCFGNGSLTCDDGNPCTMDFCLPSSGCGKSNLADQTPCGNAGLCSAGSCVPCPDGLVLIELDDGGTKKAVCAYDYPLWGNLPLAPTGTYADNGDDTVSDSLTALQWQRTQPLITGSWQNARQVCDALELAGKADWRLPTVAELQTLVNYALASPPVLDSVFVGAAQSVPVWTAQAHAAAMYADQHWTVAFDTGELKLAPQAGLRCVRGGKSAGSSLATRFVPGGNGTVADNATGLTWQLASPNAPAACANDATSGNPELCTSAHAKDYCAALALAGGGWRLPNVRELASLHDRTNAAYWLDTKVFTFGPVGLFWTSTPVAATAGGMGWVVSFGGDESPGGQITPAPPGTPARVRCVR